MFRNFNILLFLTVLLTHPAFATDEDIFKDALAYTVKIKTRVDTPFLGDERGAFMAAGFLVDVKRRWVMTNAHVVARSPSYVSVAFQKGGFHKAEKLYVDPYLDMALLKLPENSLPQGIQQASLVCDDIPAVGHPVGALGHPWGIFFTGTRGVISGITDNFGSEFLQTDAPINSGNSGGPLISMKTAQVVGINTSTINQSGDQSTNFATPSKYACRVLRLLQANKNPSPPHLPLLFQLDPDDNNQLIVASINLSPDLIALKNGDIIYEVVGEKLEIQNENHLIHAMRGQLDNLTLRITRKGATMSLKGHLNPAPHVMERRGVFVSGLLIAPWDMRDWTELSLPPLMVHNVETGSIGDNENIQIWDSLVTIDGQRMHNLTRLFTYLQTTQTQKKTVTIKIKRFSSLEDRMYDYLERPLEIQELRQIGNWEQSKEVARK
jgi:S1-C subfamily serine protease